MKTTRHKSIRRTPTVLVWKTIQNINMANTYANGQNVDEGEWHFLGSIEAYDDIFEALDLEPFAKKK